MGVGVVARYGHIPAILETGEFELHAIFDPHGPSLTDARKKFQIPHAFADAEEFFQSGIEAVTIASSAPFHKDNVLACAAHGIPALCEKPLAMTGAESREMVKAMQQAGVPLYAAFCYRFSPSALKIRELVTAGAIGEVRSLRLIYNWNLHGKYADDANGNRVLQKRREDRMLEGGPMVDCGTHQIDLATFWLNSPVIRSAGHGAWVDDHEAPDHMWLHLDHANGAHSVIEISYSYHHTTKNARSEFVYELIGTNGVIRYDREARQLFLENGEGRQDFEFHPEKEFEGMYREYANALRRGGSVLLTSAEAGLTVAEIARNATDEAIQNRP